MNQSVAPPVSPVSLVSPVSALPWPMLRSGTEVSQSPVHALQDFQTPESLVFKVSHMGISALAQLPPEQWHLEIKGLVRQPLQLSLADLAQLPRQRVLALHECAGHPLFPTVPVRRAATVEWEGVALSEIVQQAGLLPGARFMWSTGAEYGHFNKLDHPCYQKDLPLEALLAPGSKILLATHMNGAPLSIEHGAPLRLVVPDYYGTHSTKWLVALDFQAERCPAYFASQLYNDVGPDGLIPVWQIAPHALIVSETEGATINAGLRRSWGWAWASGGVAQVEVSIDGAASWQVAELDPRIDHAWQRFEFDWQAEAGAQQLLCRATARDGRVQPAKGARNEWFGVRLQVID
jgi:DMSO/TMAO reductase YedYZ molybdopterin-dependent catalytic subunit